MAATHISPLKALLVSVAQAALVSGVTIAGFCWPHIADALLGPLGVAIVEPVPAGCQSACDGIDEKNFLLSFAGGVTGLFVGLWLAARFGERLGVEL